MTWKEWKEKLEAAGLTDETHVAYIDADSWSLGDVNIDVINDGTEEVAVWA